jgi:hypothetical protein
VEVEMTEPMGELEVEVAAELSAAEEGRPTGGPEDWLVDPEEAERDEVALRSLLGAVEVLEDDLPR